MLNKLKELLQPTPELMGEMIKLMPEPIPSLVAENGRLTRLIRPIEQLLTQEQPSYITDNYWQLLTEQHAAMVEYKADVNVRLEAAIEAHNQDLKGGLQPFSWLKK